jgi:predicted RNA binding protein YcfA (HicA-like mRNA interferase family)
MARLPVLSGRQVCRALEQVGFALDHQTGSHMILRHKDPPYRRITVPDHKAVAKGTLRGILRQAGLTVDTLIEPLKQ